MEQSNAKLDIRQLLKGVEFKATDWSGFKSMV